MITLTLNVKSITKYPAYLEVYNAFCVPELIKGGFIYLGYNKRYSCYKIGLSKEPNKRAKRLGIEIVHLIKTDDMFKCEKILHWFFAPKQNKETSGRELFNLNSEDVKYIKTIAEYIHDEFMFIKYK